jgi:hypothetical protein
MQTARRAAASIADAGDNGLPFLDFVDNLGLCGSAVVGLGAPNDIGDAQLLAQHALEMLEIALCALLAVGNESHGFAAQGDRSFSKSSVCGVPFVAGIEHTYRHGFILYASANISDRSGVRRRTIDARADRCRHGFGFATHPRRDDGAEATSGAARGYDEQVVG